MIITRPVVVLMVILLMVLHTNPVLADCQAEAKTCATALNKAQMVISDQGQLITDLKKKSALDEAIKADQQSQLNSSLRDPVKVALATTILVLVLELATGHLK